MKVGDTVYNSRLGVTGELIKIHSGMGLETEKGKVQDALTVKVKNKLKVWLKDTDYVVQK